MICIHCIGNNNARFALAVWVYSTGRTVLSCIRFNLGLQEAMSAYTNVLAAASSFGSIGQGHGDTHGQGRSSGGLGATDTSSVSDFGALAVSPGCVLVCLCQ